MPINETDIYNLQINYEARAQETEAILRRMEENTRRTANAMENRLVPAANKAEKATDGFSSKVNGNLQNLNNLFGAATNGAKAIQVFVKPLVDATLALAQQGAQLAVTREKYDEMVDGMGGAAKTMLSEMRRITRGTINDQTLMQNAMRLSQLAGEEAFTSLPTLMAIATEQAKVMGISMDYALDSIITGVGRSSPLILDNLGITVNMAAANQNLAKSLGVSESALTKEQRTMALLNEIQRKYGADVEKVANQQLTVTEKMQAYNTQLENAKQTIAVSLVPALSELLDVSAPLIQDVLTEAVPIITDLIGKFGAWTKKIRENREAMQEGQQAFEAYLRARLKETGGVITSDIAGSIAEQKQGDAEGREGLIAKLMRERAVDEQVKAIQEELRLAEIVEKEYLDRGVGNVRDAAATKARIQEETVAHIQELSGRTVAIEVETARLIAEARQRVRESVSVTSVDPLSETEAAYLTAEELRQIDAQRLAEAQEHAASMVNVRAAELQAIQSIKAQAANDFAGIGAMEMEAGQQLIEQEKADAEERKLIKSGLYETLKNMAGDYQRQIIGLEESFTQSIKDIYTTHEEDVMVLQQNRAMEREALLAQHQAAMEAARRAGDERQMAQLDAKLQQGLASLANGNAKEDALNERARRVEEIKRIRSYMEELSQLQRKINQETVMRMIDAATKEKISAEALNAKLKALGIELDAQSEVAVATFKINQQKNKSEWDVTQETYKASKERIRILTAEAEKRLDIAQGNLAAWSPPPIEIPIIPDIQLGGGLGGGGGAPREETVVEALDATVGRIVDIIGNAMDTMEKLIGYESRADEVKQAAERLGADIREMIAALFPHAESFGRDASGKLVNDWRDIPKAVAEFAQWASAVIGAYGSALATLSNMADFVPTDVGGKIAFIADAIRVMIVEMDRVREMFANEGEMSINSTDWRQKPKDAAHFAQYAVEVIGVIKTTAEAIRALVDLPQLENIGSLLDGVKRVVAHWMRRISDLTIAYEDFYADEGKKFQERVGNFASLIEKAFSALGRIADVIPKLVDLPSFNDTLGVFTEVKRYVAHWLRRMTDLYQAFAEHYQMDEKSPLIGKVQEFATMLDRLFATLSRVTDSIRKLEDIPGFDQSTVDTFDRLKRYVAHWLRRITDLSIAFEEKYGKDLLAKLGPFSDALEGAFSLLGSVADNIQKMKDAPGFDQSTIDIFDNIKKYVAHWLRRITDLSIAFEEKYGKDLLAKLGGFSEALADMFSMLGEVIETIQKLKDIPGFDQTTVDIFDRLKRYVAHWLRRMADLSEAFEGRYGEKALAKLKPFVAAISDMFGLLRKVMEIIGGLKKVPNFDESTIRVFDRLKRYVAHWLRRLSDLQQAFEEKYGLDMTESMKDFVEMLRSSFGALKEALEVINILGTVNLRLPTQTFDNLQDMIQRILDRLQLIADQYEGDAGRAVLARIKTLADALKPVGEALSAIVRPFAEVARMRWIPEQALAALKMNVEAVIAWFFDIANSISEDPEILAERLESVGSVGRTVAEVISGFKEAADAMFELGEGGKVPDESAVGKVGAFIRQVFALLESVTSGITAGTGEDPAAGIERIKDVIGGIIGVFDSALNAIDRLLETQVPKSDTIQGFVQAIITLYTEFSRVLGLMEYDVSNFLRDISWYAVGQGLVQSLIDGIYSMEQGLTAANGWLWAFLGGMPGGGMGAAAAGAGSTSTSNYTVNQYGVPEAGHGVRNAVVAMRTLNTLRGP